MNRVLQVHDRVSLPEVIEALLPEARDLSWSVLDLNEVVPAKGWDLRIPFREPRVAESPTGWQLSLDELVAFGEWARQIIDGLFVACTSAERFPVRSDSDATILERADMLVAAIDSTFWLVSASDEVLARVERTFDDAREVDPAAIRLSIWPRDYGPEGPRLDAAADRRSVDR